MLRILCVHMGEGRQVINISFDLNLYSNITVAFTERAVQTFPQTNHFIKFTSSGLV